MDKLTDLELSAATIACRRDRSLVGKHKAALVRARDKLRWEQKARAREKIRTDPEHLSRHLAKLRGLAGDMK